MQTGFFLMKYYIRIPVLSLLIFSGFLTTGFAQGYQIDANIKGIRDSSLILAHYSKSSTLFVPKDTAKADAEGNVVFTGKKNLAGRQNIYEKCYFVTKQNKNKIFCKIFQHFSSCQIF